MKLADGDILELRDNIKAVLLFAANNVLDRHGHLVMGAGGALAFKEAAPWLPGHLGHLISKAGPEYGLVLATAHSNAGTYYGAFQSKRHWRDPSDLELIASSAIKLGLLARQQPEREFHLTYPGIGRGGLSVTAVAPLLEGLPDNVTVWRR